MTCPRSQLQSQISNKVKGQGVVTVLEDDANDLGKNDPPASSLEYLTVKLKFFYFILLF